MVLTIYIYKFYVHIAKYFIHPNGKEESFMYFFVVFCFFPYLHHILNLILILEINKEDRGRVGKTKYHNMVDV